MSYHVRIIRILPSKQSMVWCSGCLFCDKSYSPVHGIRRRWDSLVGWPFAIWQPCCVNRSVDWTGWTGSSTAILHLLPCLGWHCCCCGKLSRSVRLLSQPSCPGSDAMSRKPCRTPTMTLTTRIPDSADKKKWRNHTKKDNTRTQKKKCWKEKKRKKTLPVQNEKTL